MFVNDRNKILQSDKSDRERLDILFRQNDTLLKLLNDLATLQAIQATNSDKIARQLAVHKEILEFLFKNGQFNNLKEFDSFLDRLEKIKDEETK